MAAAIDRDFVIDIVRSGLTTPADGPFDPTSKWFAETDYPDHDVDEAIRLVDEYEAENGPISFVLKGEPGLQSEELRDLVVSFWQDAGMEVTQEEIGPGTSVSTAISDEFQAIVWTQFNAADPDGDYSFFRSGGPLNWTNFVDERIDSALDLGRSTGDFDARYAAYAEFQQVLASEVPIVWIDHLGGVESVVSVPTVHNIAERTLPDGTPGQALLAGSFFSYEDVWMEQ
ncbi:MAG: ABC transporter substrate-binding protein, partial [Ilumatobacter sp.]